MQRRWPDDDSLEVSIASIQDINGKTHIIVKCEFNEVVPTGCADIENSESGYGELEIVIDPKRKNAYFQCEEEDV
ncbi:hypothetical protein GCM10010981_39540 [Dyella nitratireducens]|uniref:Uncharacterized protein n=1 Tax=Dyella nitratireducens TaxID=1849580 RepID=A0ABQ1GME8_9GAMM|nr:hypothetical protein GCM10010981_39540 [Dyella nitratireducens]GLQ41456.1 hypothetical protein GCM10007902_13060 [Dyella nitratireducens]